MKKLFIISALVLGLVSAQAASSTVVISAGGFSNLLSNFRGSAKVTDILITAPSTNAAQLRLIDTVTNTLTYTSPAYSNITSYVTNYITSYTDFQGRAVLITNQALVDITNSVAASTNNYPVRFVGNAATNSSSLYSGVDTYFQNGVWATNSSVGGSVTVTITYQQ